MKQLPFRTIRHAFSKDGKSLHLYDPVRVRPCLLDDRERTADPVANLHRPCFTLYQRRPGPADRDHLRLAPRVGRPGRRW